MVLDISFVDHFPSAFQYLAKFCRTRGIKLEQLWLHSLNKN